MSRPSSGYDYTFVRVEDFDCAKKISIAETCNGSVKTLLSQEDKLTTPNMCLNRIARGDSSFRTSRIGRARWKVSTHECPPQPRSGARMQPTAQAVGKEQQNPQPRRGVDRSHEIHQETTRSAKTGRPECRDVRDHASNPQEIHSPHVTSALASRPNSVRSCSSECAEADRGSKA